MERVFYCCSLELLQGKISKALAVPLTAGFFHEITTPMVLRYDMFFTVSLSKASGGAKGWQRLTSL